MGPRNVVGWGTVGAMWEDKNQGSSDKQGCRFREGQSSFYGLPGFLQSAV